MDLFGYNKFTPIVTSSGDIEKGEPLFTVQGGAGFPGGYNDVISEIMHNHIKWEVGRDEFQHKILMGYSIPTDNERSGLPNPKALNISLNLGECQNALEALRWIEDNDPPGIMPLPFVFVFLLMNKILSSWAYPLTPFFERTYLMGLMISYGAEAAGWLFDPESSPDPNTSLEREAVDRNTLPASECKFLARKLLHLLTRVDVNSVDIDNERSIQDAVIDSMRRDPVWGNLRTTDFARIILDLGKLLWDVEWMSRDEFLGLGTQYVVCPLLNGLAMVDLLLKDYFSVELDGKKIVIANKDEFVSYLSLSAQSVDMQNHILRDTRSEKEIREGIRAAYQYFMNRLSTWTQLLEFCVNRVSKEALLSLKGDVRLAHPQNLIDETRFPIRFSKPTRETLSILRDTFLNDAVEKASFTPASAFTVEIPKEVNAVLLKAPMIMSENLRRVFAKSHRDLPIIDIQSLTIVIDESGMWVKPVMRGDLDSYIFRWNAFISPHITNFHMSNNVTLWFDTVLSGIWRDWRVEKTEAFHRMKRPNYDIWNSAVTNAEEMDQNKHRHKHSPSTRSFPRESYTPATSISREEYYSWGSESDHEIIKRRLHGVSGHRRQLRDGWQTSEKQKLLAEANGIILPKGFTYVRHHHRGRNKDGGEDYQIPEKTVIRAKALATLISLDLSEDVVDSDENNL